MRWVFGYTRQLTHKEWTAILAWPGYRVYRHELDEEAKTLKLWVRRKPVHRGFECSGCGRRLHEVHDVREREIRDLPWSVYRATVVVEVHRLRCPECGVRVEKIEQLPSKAPFSKRFEEAVGEACESAAASQVARHSTCRRPRCEPSICAIWNGGTSGAEATAETDGGGRDLPGQEGTSF